jgi:restriction system protein
VSAPMTASNDLYRARRAAEAAEQAAIAQSRHEALTSLMATALALPPVSIAEMAWQRIPAPAWDAAGFDRPQPPPERRFGRSERNHQRALEEHARSEMSRAEALQGHWQAHEHQRCDAEDQRAPILALDAQLRSGSASAADVELAARWVLHERTPTSIPSDAAGDADPPVVASAGRGRLVIEFAGPPGWAIPDVIGYRYVKTADEIRPAAIKERERTVLYRSVLAQLALRTAAEVLRAVQPLHEVVVNGEVTVTDAASGTHRRGWAVSVMVDRSRLQGADLVRADPISCLLRHFSGRLAARPFDGDIVSRIVPAPSNSGGQAAPDSLDLLAMSPTEFEVLVTDLFRAMGVRDAETTKASGDGGVDIRGSLHHAGLQAFPVIVQVKRYRHLVPVDMVRALHGVAQHEGVAKAFLVTASGFGPSSHAYCADKQIELIDGPRLVQLLAEHLSLASYIGA